MQRLTDGPTKSGNYTSTNLEDKTIPTSLVRRKAPDVTDRSCDGGAIEEAARVSSKQPPANVSEKDPSLRRIDR